MQQLDVVYAGGYFQDEWRPRGNLTVTAGLRVDVPKFGNTAFDNPAADSLTFRDQDGSPVKYNSGALPEATPYWSPRVGFNWDALSNGTTQIRGGSGIFTGKPPYVWISNQIGNTGVLYGFTDTRPAASTTAFPFNPNPDKYKPAANGALAASYELDVTDAGFRFPQTWRTSLGVDRRTAVGHDGDGRLRLQPRPERSGLHQREPARADHGLHGRGRTAEVGGNRRRFLPASRRPVL